MSGPEPDLADDDQALTALSHAFRDTHDDATRTDAIGRALFAGWLEGRVSELRDLLDEGRVGEDTKASRLIRKRLDALAELAANGG